MWEIADLKGFRASFAEFRKGQKNFPALPLHENRLCLNKGLLYKIAILLKYVFFHRHSPAISPLCYTETKLYLEGIA
ncbi:hypothetical protein DP119_02405 [Planococcus maitriensis]|uniref:Uncharacterized protein n=1 Tax=Planococcus maitriensis TaxID=221799 RepID=A0A365KB27_9BACL|nr:hypothetical protein DP119_02405 [Planococcus maitriensis]